MQHTTTDSKPFWQSKTLLSLIPVVLSLIFGGNIDDPEYRDATEKLAGVVTVAGVIYGRRKASAQITLGKSGTF